MRPPLGLSVNVTRPDGTVTRWGANDPKPENRPRNLTWATRRMQGFADGGCNLARRLDRDYPDLNLYDSVEFVGDDGSTAYDGRIGGLPRTMDDRHTISLQLAGWIAHAADRPFSRVFIDRDLARWQEASLARKAALAAIYDFGATSIASGADEAGQRGLILTVNAVPFTNPGGEIWYDAGPQELVAEVRVTPTLISFGLPDGGLSHDVFAATTDTAVAAIQDLKATNGTATVFQPAAKGRYAGLGFAWLNAAGGTAGTPYGARWQNIAVIGDHGLTVVDGVLASDVIKHIAGRYCPLLNTSGVQSTTYPIPQLVFDQVKPYDAWLAVNAYHLWNLAVWERRTLHYGPADLTDYDWEIRLDDPGVAVSLQGDSTEDLANGIVIGFENLSTGQHDILTPDTHAELRDDSVENPANQHGLQAWTQLDLSFPSTVDGALQLGRAALAEFNQPKAPGSITAGPYIRDRAGHWQQYWKVRAGDRVAITSSTSLSDRPRVIHETSHDHDGLRVTMAVDSTFKTLPAVFDRITTALAANNLG
jgi:hypothetical protein